MRMATLVNMTNEVNVPLIPVEVVVSTLRAITCGNIATTILSTEHHNPATAMSVVMAAETAMEDAVTMLMEAITAKVEGIKANAKPIYRILDTATGQMTAKINRSMQLMLNSIWQILLYLGMKEALPQVQLVAQVPRASLQAPVDVTEEVIPGQMFLQETMDGDVPKEVIPACTEKCMALPNNFMCPVCLVCPVFKIKIRLLETFKPMLKYSQKGPA